MYETHSNYYNIIHIKKKHQYIFISLQLSYNSLNVIHSSSRPTHWHVHIYKFMYKQPLSLFKKEKYSPVMSRVRRPPPHECRVIHFTQWKVLISKRTERNTLFLLLSRFTVVDFFFFFLVYNIATSCFFLHLLSLFLFFYISICLSLFRYFTKRTVYQLFNPTFIRTFFRIFPLTPLCLYCTPPWITACAPLFCTATIYI